jgi:uncharacterized protein (TIGR01244 family)
MDFQRAVSAEITVADAPTAADLAAAAAEGYRTVLDLRAPEEPLPAPDRLAPADEARLAAELGLHYENVPVRLEQVDDALVRRVGERLAAVEKPVLVHCAHGRRAGAMVLMHLAVERGLTAPQCLGLAKAMGYDCESQPQLAQLVAQYVERHSPAYQR